MFARSVIWGYSEAMDRYFAALESKVDRVVDQCDRLRSENQRLRQELIERSEELRAMSTKMEEARYRLQKLMDRTAEVV